MRKCSNEKNSGETCRSRDGYSYYGIYNNNCNNVDCENDDNDNKKIKMISIIMMKILTRMMMMIMYNDNVYANDDNTNRYRNGDNKW